MPSTRQVLQVIIYLIYLMLMQSFWNFSRADITMYETLLRPHEVQQFPTPLPLSHVIDKLKDMEKFREEKRLRQIANHKRKREDAEFSEPDKRARTDELSAGDQNSLQAPLITVREEDDANEVEAQMVSLSKVCHEVRGHTSYLTFARLVPFMPETLESAAQAPPPTDN